LNIAGHGIDAAALRLVAQKKGIAEVHQDMQGLVIYFLKSFQLPDKSFQILTSRPNDFKFVPGESPGVRLIFKEEENPLDALGRFIREIFETNP